MKNAMFSDDAATSHNIDNTPCQSFISAVAIPAGRAKEPPASSHLSKPEALTPPSREDAIKQGRLILVAEDSETNQIIIKHLLGLLGYTADFSGNGREALNNIRKTRYALLLTDLHMPEMDGYELTASIRAIETKGHRIPIVALSASDLEDEAVRCCSVGIDDFISKPIRIEDLKVTLANLMPTGFSKDHKPRQRWSLFDDLAELVC